MKRFMLAVVLVATIVAAMLASVVIYAQPPAPLPEATTSDVIILRLDNVIVNTCGETWTEQGVILSFVETTAEDCTDGRCSFGTDTNQVWLYPARLNLDLSGVAGIVTSVEIDIVDWCGVGCTKAFLYDGTTTIDSDANSDVSEGETLLLLNDGQAPVDRIAVSSCEGEVYEIRLRVTPTLCDSTILTLDNVIVSTCGETWTEQGVTLSFVETTAEDCGSGGRCSFGTETNLVWLYPARLNLDLSGLAGIVTSVEIDIIDWCGVGCTRAFLYDGITTIDSDVNSDVSEEETLLLLNDGQAPVDRIAVSSCEGVVYEIRLETTCCHPVAGITRGVNSDDLSGVQITLDGVGPVLSDINGYYEIIAPGPGTYSVIAVKEGFREKTQVVEVDCLSPVTVNFQGAYGLIPCAPDMWYALDCVNMWLYPPGPETGLDMWTALEVVNAWLYPGCP